MMRAMFHEPFAEFDADSLAVRTFSKWAVTRRTPSTASSLTKSTLRKKSDL